MGEAMHLKTASAKASPPPNMKPEILTMRFIPLDNASNMILVESTIFGTESTLQSSS